MKALNFLRISRKSYKLHEIVTEIKSFILQWWGIVWIAERILRCLLCHCFAELGCLHCCGMKVPKTAIEIRKALIFLESTAGHRRPVLLVKNLRSENSDFIKICKNEGSDVWNIVSHRKLILPVMFASITLKYYSEQFTRQLVPPPVHRAWVGCTKDI